MENELASILGRLQRKGSNAQELLPIYYHRDYESLWKQSPLLYGTFARKLINQGHPTRAFELTREGLASHPGDGELTYLLALALARGGNASAARTHIAKLLLRTDLEVTLRTEALSLEGRLFKDRYERTPDAERKADAASKSAACYRRAAELSGSDSFPLINAATMTLLAGDGRQAVELANAAIRQVRREIPAPESSDNYWLQATLGEGYLLLGDLEEAARWYGLAVAKAREQGDVGSISSMRRNALLLREKLDVGDELLRHFYIGSVVVFAGHMIDHPARGYGARLPATFPPDPQLIRETAEAIRGALADLNATVAFCSAASGSDILFAEQMLERSAEVHIVLPFARADFVRTSVDFDLPEMKHWRVRFDALMERATQVHYATTEAYLGHDVLFDFVNHFSQGLAVTRAMQRGVIPQALVVLDPGAPKHLGGTACFLDMWKRGNYPARTIDLKELRERILGASTAAPPTLPKATVASSNDGMERQVKSMLFADVKGFSKLKEEDSPRFFLRFLQEVDGVLHSLRNAPTFSNTWGDGLYLVFDHVIDCAETALRLLERAEQLNWKDLGLDETTPVRVGIHAGPVFNGMDPIIGRKNYFGSHVTRAARIEPVTIPGCAYTSEQFAALLAADPGHDFVCEYIGIEPLAKEYDRCPLYRLARR